MEKTKSIDLTKEEIQQITYGLRLQMRHIAKTITEDTWFTTQNSLKVDLLKTINNSIIGLEEILKLFN